MVVFSGENISHEIMLYKHIDGRWQQLAATSHASVSFCQTPNSSLYLCSASVRPTQGLADGSSIVYCTTALYKVPPLRAQALYKVRGALGQGRIPRPVFPVIHTLLRRPAAPGILTCRNFHETENGCRAEIWKVQNQLRIKEFPPSPCPECFPPQMARIVHLRRG